MKLKYTKTEQARQKKVLSVSLRMLPLFEAMEKSLISTISAISEKMESIGLQMARKEKEAMPWLAVFSDSWVDISAHISVERLNKRPVDVAGVRVQEFQGVDFNIRQPDGDTPLWVDDAIELIQEQIELRLEMDCLETQILVLEEELREVRARIKLFENRRIPNARIAIRKIGQKLQDDERITIATAKVVKTKEQKEAAK